MSQQLQEQNKIGFALVSSNRNRILFFNPSYEVTKRIQLHYMRNDLLYLIPVTNFMQLKHRKDIGVLTSENCINFTLNNASVLHVEMDVAPLILKDSYIMPADTPSNDELAIHKNLQIASAWIEKFDTAFNKRLDFYRFQYQYIIQGYQMFEEFCVNNLDDCESLQSIIQTDLRDELTFERSIKRLRKIVTATIMELDYTNADFETAINSKLQSIQENESKNPRDKWFGKIL